MLRSEGKIINYETLFLSKHGERIPVSLSASVLKASGNPSRETVYIIKNKSLEKKLEDQLKQEYMHMIRTLAGVIEMKDEYTGAHISRVTSWSLRIAERMGLSEEEKRNIEIGATLHDIGKIGIPETILKKPALLSDPERVRIQDHPTLGARVLSSLESFGTVVDIVRYHHENYDGSGYPYGLAGDEIPLGARIVAVADSFDAMNTDREYRKKIGLEKSLEILEAEAGKQFDPEIVRIFVDIIREEQQSEKKNTEKIGNL
jgi:putative nucleotidyltransferase with HDIG domain